MVEPHITFGMIVLNGEPFIRYTLRSLYPWAHQIIVVEGACPAAVAVATPDGHSTDDTLDVLQRFKDEEDPENKIIIVMAEDEGHQNGFWPGEKHEMSQAYARRATGNFLWQVDADEFYREEDMPAIITMLETGCTQISFPILQFWGGIGFRENGEYLSIHFTQIHRVFAWGKNFTYRTHRPPTVEDDHGTDVRGLQWMSAASMRKKNIFLYHYCMVLPHQVRQKCSYYSRVDWAAFQQMETWAENVYFKFLDPFAVCDVLHYPTSWLEEYRGVHPRQILNMIADISAGRHPNVELRQTEDILRVITTPRYRAGRLMRKAWVGVLPIFYQCISITVRLARHVPLYSVLHRMLRRNFEYPRSEIARANALGRGNYAA